MNELRNLQNLRLLVLSLDGAALSERPPITSNEHHNSRTIGQEKREQHRFAFPRARVRGIAFEMLRGSHLINNNDVTFGRYNPL
jgi:hypothetical protein